MEGEDMDSLFEGMELFTPSQLPSNPPEPSENLATPDDSSGKTATAAEPLDENLFSDLTIVTPVETLSLPSDPVPATSAVSASSDIATTTQRTMYSRQASRRKKRAAGLRIGYGRESSTQLNENNHDEDDDDAVSQKSDSVSQQSDVGSQQSVSVSQHSDSISQQSDFASQQTEIGSKQSVSVSQQPETVDGILGLDQVKALIAEKLSLARQMAASISTARKDAIRERRKAAESLSMASAKHCELEKQLEEACEAEDFEAAERISENLGSVDRERNALVDSLRQAESHCDSMDSKMQEVLLLQIKAEEECASLLRSFSMDSENDADVLLKKAESCSSEEMKKWQLSVEAVEIRKIELDIESQIVNDTRLSLNGTLEKSVEPDMIEKEFLSKKKDKLADELQELLALVKAKEKEIEENDLQITAVEERIGNAVLGYKEVQASMESKYNELQSGLSQVDKETEALSRKKKEIDDFTATEKDRGAKLKELAKVSADEAKEYEEAVRLRIDLMAYASKAREDRVKLVKTEENLSEEVQLLQQEIFSTRESLKEVSSKKSIIQQNIASLKEKMLFIDKRMPELEAEKKVAAAARNFKEAARIASEAKTLSHEKDSIQTEMQTANSELEKTEHDIEETVNKLQEIEGLILSKEKEVAIARFQRLRIDADAARAERSSALELGDLEEANLLSSEADEAEAEAEKLKPACDVKEDEADKSSKRFISMELVANLGLKQLAELAESVDLSAQTGSNLD